MEDLAEAIPSLQYAIARPGKFADFFPETTDDMLLSVLMDGLAECHLEGLLLDYESDANGLLTPALSSGQVAMVVLFSALRLLRAELINRNTSAIYEAGSAHYEYTQATNILRDIMKALAVQKDRLVEQVGVVGAASAFWMADQYLARLCGYDTVAVGW